MSAFPLLTRIVGREMFTRLVAMLPPPDDDTLETLISRDATAVAAILALGPIRSAEEASLAITIVAADCHAHDALRAASQNAGDLGKVRQCRSQAMLMLRTRAKAVERLEKLQARHPVEVARDDVAPAETSTEAEAPSQPPAATVTPEAYARRRAAAVAAYAQLTGHHAVAETNNTDISVSMVPPAIAIIASRPEPLAWRPAA